MTHPDNLAVRAALEAALVGAGTGEERRVAANAVMTETVRQLRKTLAVSMVAPCDCGLTEDEHLADGAAVLVLRFDEDVAAMLAGVMLAELHRVAPVAAFDVN